LNNPPAALDMDFRRLQRERPPVLLLGGLDLLRPLGFASIPAIVALQDPRDPAFASRYCTGRCVLPPARNPEAVAETLLAVGDRLVNALGCRVPLMYGNDDHLQLVHRYRDEFARYFLLLLNEPDVTRGLIEKDLFEPLARERGIPIPRTYAWADAGPHALGRVAGPVLVKSKDKLNWEDSPVYQRLLGRAGKARVFESGRQVMADPLARQLKDHLTFQEYVRGDDRHLWSFHGFSDQRGALLAWFIGRKIRTYPALTGVSTFLELTHNDTLAALGCDIVARMRLKGVFKIDLKQDAVDRSFRVLEINARYNLWHHLGSRNGVNLPQVAYDYLVDGARPVRTDYRTAYRWLFLRSDYRAYCELASRNEITAVRWAWSLLASRKVYHLFSWTDPKPMFRRFGDRLRSWMRRGPAWVILRLRQWLFTAS
jgi:D-aspartate ligase